MFGSTARFKALAVVTRVLGRQGRYDPHSYFPWRNFVTYWRFWTIENRISEHFRKPVFRRPRLLSQTADNKSQTNMARSSGSAQAEISIFSGGCSMLSYAQHLMPSKYSLLTKMSTTNTRKIALILKRCPSYYSLSRKMKRFPFCYDNCDVTLIQLKMSITSNLPHVIG